MEQKQLSVNKKIGLKPWFEYSLEEKMSLLMHWWQHFGIYIKRGDIYVEFLTLLKQSPDSIWYIAVQGYAKGKGNECLIDAIKHDDLAETIIQANMAYAMACLESNTDEFDKLTSLESALLTELVESYNNYLYIEDGPAPKPQNFDDTKIIVLSTYKGQ